MTIKYQRNGTANLFMMFAPLEGPPGSKDLQQASHQGTLAIRLPPTPA